MIFNKKERSIKTIDTATVIICLFSIAASMFLFFKIIFQHYELESYRDNFTRFERNISLLKEDLPLRGTVGYFNDIEPEILYSQEIWRTQYAISPLIIQKNLDHQFIVGVLHPSVPERTRYEERNMSLIKDYGEGITLLQRHKK